MVYKGIIKDLSNTKKINADHIIGILRIMYHELLKNTVILSLLCVLILDTSISKYGIVVTKSKHYLNIQLI